MLGSTREGISTPPWLPLKWLKSNILFPWKEKPKTPQVILICSRPKEIVIAFLLPSPWVFLDNGLESESFAGCSGTLTCLLIVRLSHSGVVSYYLFLILETIGITSVTEQTLLNGFLNVWNMILAVSAALIIDSVGRRKLFLTSCAIMLASYITITALSGSFAQNNSKATGIAVSNFSIPLG